MTVYELARTLSPLQLSQMTKAGILSSTTERNMYIYELWCKRVCEGVTKSEAYYLVGEECFTCAENVKKIIKKMRKKVQ